MADVDDLGEMLRQAKHLGWVGLATMVVGAGVSAFLGFWVGAVSLAMSCGFIGFGLGSLTNTIIRREQER